jgi:hypothetical protein
MTGAAPTHDAAALTEHIETRYHARHRAQLPEFAALVEKVEAVHAGGVTTTQQDSTILHALRPAYSHDSDSLIEVSGVVAAYFATIAAANEYWRE